MLNRVSSSSMRCVGQVRGQCAGVARAGDLGVEVVAEGQGQLGRTVE